MGAVYLAWDPMLERQIVLKLLRDDSEGLRERFTREAKAVARLHHPHIVTIFDVGEDHGQPFIAMEYVEGPTLFDVIRARTPLPIDRRLELVEQLCDGLAFAHRAGIVHRDIKPANLMVDREGMLKVLDFGIARVGPAATTHAGTLVGTLNYMSPEQVMGQALDHRSDIFAVGGVFYELLSYRQAFPGGLDSGILNRILHQPPEPLATICQGLDPDIVRVVEKAMEKDPAKRYQDLPPMRREVHRIRLRYASSNTQIDVDTNALNCGDCGVRCPAPPANGVGKCSARKCGIECNAGYAECTPGECVALKTFYRDADGDGFGTTAQTEQKCAPSPGFVAVAGDCHDGNPAVFPGQTKFFGTPYDSPRGPSYDYNCDGVETAQNAYKAFTTCSDVCKETGLVAPTQRTGPGVDTYCGATTLRACNTVQIEVPIASSPVHPRAAPTAIPANCNTADAIVPALGCR